MRKWDGKCQMKIDTKVGMERTLGTIIDGNASTDNASVESMPQDIIFNKLQNSNPLTIDNTFVVVLYMCLYVCLFIYI